MPGRSIDTPEDRVNARLGRVLQQPRCSTRGGRRPSSGAEKKERDGGEPLAEPAQPEETMSDSAARSRRPSELSIPSPATNVGGPRSRSGSSPKTAQTPGDPTAAVSGSAACRWERQRRNGGIPNGAAVGGVSAMRYQSALLSCDLKQGQIGGSTVFVTVYVYSFSFSFLPTFVHAISRSCGHSLRSNFT